MKTLKFFSIPASRTIRVSSLAFIFVFAVSAIMSTSAPAEEPQPTAIPQVSPNPSPTPSISTPGIYLPQSATVQLAATSGTSTSPANQQNTQSRSSNSQAGTPAISDATSPTPQPQPLLISSPDLFAPTVLAAQPQPATVTLSYNVACAGAKVLVAPLDGGNINGSSGAKTVTVGNDGTLVFSFQAPAGPGRYHVLTRLGDSEIGFPFDVAAPTDASSAPAPSSN